MVQHLCTAENTDTHNYVAEFKAFKKNPYYKTMFDEEAVPGLKEIRKDIENYKQLSLFQRFVRFLFIALDGVVITKEGMPTLYVYIENLCRRKGITMPTVFINTGKGFFNAAAQKFSRAQGQ